MIFDSEEQKARVLDLIGEVPITTNIKGLVSGVSPDLANLLDSIRRAEVLSIDDQTTLLIRKELDAKVRETFGG